MRLIAPIRLKYPSHVELLGELTVIPILWIRVKRDSCERDEGGEEFHAGAEGVERR